MLQKLFLPYLKKRYRQNRDLVGCLEINLINHYLKLQEGPLAGDSYIDYITVFSALACQETFNFKRLVDEMQLSSLLDVNALERDLNSISFSEEKNFEILDRIEHQYREVLPLMLSASNILWSSSEEKKRASEKIQKDFKQASDLFETNERWKKHYMESRGTPTDDHLKNIIHDALIVQNKPLQEVFNKVCSQVWSWQLLEVALENRVEELIGILVEGLETKKFALFLGLLSSPPNIRYYFQHPKLKRSG